MSTFSKIWDTEVKKLAQACITEPKMVEIMNKEKSYKLNKEEEEYLKSIDGKYKDPYGMYYISEMIWKVEHALADDKEPMAEVAIVWVYEVLNRPSYFKNVFGNNEEDEEWKTRAALRDGLKKLINT